MFDAAVSFTSVDWAVEYFRVLGDVVPPEQIRMSGGWVSRPQRRYASERRPDTGEGPYVEKTEWRWEGAFESASALTGIALLSDGEGMYWVKSNPPVLRPEVAFSAYGWAARPGAVSAMASFHRGFLPPVLVEVGGEPTASCVIGQPNATTGRVHVVARLEGVQFAVLLLPSSAVKVGRNRLWHLREHIASRLPPELQRLTTRGRSGRVVWA